MYVPPKEKSRRARSGELGGHVIWLSVSVHLAVCIRPFGCLCPSIWLSVSVHFHVQFWSSEFQIAVWTWSGVPPCWNSLYLGPFSSKIGVRNSSIVSGYTVPVTVPSARKDKHGTFQLDLASSLMTYELLLYRDVECHPGRRTVLSSPNGICRCKNCVRLNVLKKTCKSNV